MGQFDVLALQNVQNKSWHIFEVLVKSISIQGEMLSRELEKMKHQDNFSFPACLRSILEILGDNLNMFGGAMLHCLPLFVMIIPFSELF